MSSDQANLFTNTASERLRATALAVRVQFTWMGVQKTVSSAAKEQMAEAVSAQATSVGATKKILDTKAAEFKALTALRQSIKDFWKGTTLPYVDDGVRLMPAGQLDSFVTQMATFRSELASAVLALAGRYESLKQEARVKLGDLYNPNDYPPDITHLFQVEWDFPSVEPPDYLMQVRPDLYRLEQQRVAARFEEAVRLAEQSFASELSKLVEHMIERLQPGDDGLPKVFRNTAIDNFQEFFSRFRTLNVNSSADLDRVIGQAEQLVRGLTPADLRAMPDVRQNVQAGLAAIQGQLDNLIVDQPRRRIVRPAVAPAQNAEPAVNKPEPVVGPDATNVAAQTSDRINELQINELSSDDAPEGDHNVA